MKKKSAHWKTKSTDIKAASDAKAFIMKILPRWILSTSRWINRQIRNYPVSPNIRCGVC